MSIIAVDIGNNYSKAAVFTRGKIQADFRTKGFQLRWLSRILKNIDRPRIIISSVKKLRPAQLKYLKSLSPLFLNHKTPIPFKSLYATPQTLGMDRIASVAGGLDMFPGKNVMVADMGTCLTIDFIDKEKQYHGGSISPGLEMRLKAMHHFTSKLPLLRVENTPNHIGDSTKTSMLSGAIEGIIGEIEWRISRYKDDFGPLNVILTGGNSSFFAKHLKTKIFVEPNLNLLGLRLIIEHNL